MSKALFPEKPAVRPLDGTDYELAQDFFFRATVGGEGRSARGADPTDGRAGSPCPPRGAGRAGSMTPPHDDGAWDVVVHVKPGFRTDGASIPRLLWRVFGSPYDPDIFPAAIGHDALYRGEIVPRKDADAAFLRMMEESGVPERKRRLVYRGVRWFGWITWLGHTDESVRDARRYIEMDFVPQAIRNDQT